MKSKNYLKIVLGIMFVVTLCFGVSLNAQDEKIIEKIEVPLSKPGSPVNLTVKVNSGNLNIIGYNGKIVLVEVLETKPGKISKNNKIGKRFRERGRVRDLTTDKKNDKAKGMFKISNSGLSLSIVEEDNTVVIKNGSYNENGRSLIRIKVPFKTSVKATMMMHGKAQISGVTGEHVVKHMNGSIIMKKINGSVIANSMNGDINVSFNKVALDRPMSFSTFNGDVDVTIPDNSKYNFKLKTSRGEIYSDFKLVMNKNTKTRNINKNDSGKYRVNIDNTVYAALNGGGEEIYCKTWSGDIYIRKKK